MTQAPLQSGQLSFDSTAPPPDVRVDLDRLITTRLLIQAASGGGKSWALRYMLEHTQDRVQQFVLDSEGDFATLRERFPYLLVGKKGELPAVPENAHTLARRLMELNTSAVLDLSDLDHDARHLFVKRFIEGLRDLPQDLWHAVIVALDEAQLYAPETGKGASIAKSAVVDLATLGRKRAQCLWCATQRIARVTNDVLAELQNKVIGLTTLTTDVNRAAEDLGFDRNERRALRSLDPGYFYVVGPALSRVVTLVRTGAVQTTHREPGTLAPPVPPTPDAIKRLVSQLRDLPVETEATDLDAALRKIARLEAQLQAEHDNPIVEVREIERLVFDETLAVEMRGVAHNLDALGNQVHSWASEIRDQVDLAIDRARERSGASISIVPAPAFDADALQLIRTDSETSALYESESEDVARAERPERVSDASLKAGARRMLQVLATTPQRSFTRVELGTLAKMRSSSGTFSSYLSLLRTRGLIIEDRDLLRVAPAGLDYLGQDVPAAPTTTEELLAQWDRSLKRGERTMLHSLVAIHPEGFTKRELSAKANMTHTSGTFGSYLSTLRRNGLIAQRGSRIYASDTLFIHAQQTRRSRR